MPAYKYQTKDGKTRWYASFHYVDWTGANKRKKKQGFLTREEALEYEHNFLDSKTKDPDITFAALVDLYLEDCQKRLKPSTMEHKTYALKDKLVPYFGKTKISAITPLKVREWQNEMMNYRNKSDKPYAPTYLRNLQQQLSAVMNFAVKYYDLRKNPCQAAGTMGKGKADEMSIWTRDEFEHFIQFEKKPVYHLAFNTLFYTGIREGELLALTPEDIPRDEAVIRVSKTYAVVDGIEVFLTPKTEKSNRTVTIHDELHKELLDYIDGSALKKNERIFYFTKHGLLCRFHNVSDKAGLRRLRVHDLRHSHASMLINMGVPIIQISERLGHESPQTTLRIYSHLYPEKARAVSDQIGALFSHRVEGQKAEKTDAGNK